MIKKVSIIVLSALVIISMLPLSVLAEEGNSDEEIVVQEENTVAEFEEPIYDAETIMAEAEAEQEYRDSVDYAEETVVFSVLDYRDDGSAAQYLNSKSEICQKYSLKKVELVIDVKKEDVEYKEGKTAYQVFYSASVKTDDIWRVIDQMSEEEGILSAEPDYIWESTAEDDMTEVSEEELAFSDWGHRV